ncbi:MAG: endonuclease/exonuclease/phosphatase family protein, partial [Bryobacteraceae bacterium]
MRVATYNVHKCKGLDRRVDPKRVAEVIAEVDPDVVGVQEVFGEQAKMLAGELGMHLALGDVRPLNGDVYG